jgi:hypothetical protein
MRPPGGELCRLFRRLFDPRHCRSGIVGSITPSVCRACSRTGPPPDQGARAERLMHQNSDVRNSNSLLRRNVNSAPPTAKTGGFRRSTGCIRSIPDALFGFVLRASGGEHLSLFAEQCCHGVLSLLSDPRQPKGAVTDPNASGNRHVSLPRGGLSLRARYGKLPRALRRPTLQLPNPGKPPRHAGACEPAPGRIPICARIGACAATSACSPLDASLECLKSYSLISNRIR